MTLLDGCFNVGTKPTQYAGPGDVVPNAFAYWALRAYSFAKTGTVAVNLRRDSDNATQDFVTLSNGNLDIASITSFKGGANLFVAKLYDQTGNGNDFAQATAANQPAFTLNGLGSLPVMTFDGSTTFLFTSITPQLRPFTLIGLAKRTSVTFFPQIIADLGNNGIDFASTADSMRGRCSLPISAAALENQYHSIQFAFNGASSVVQADSTSVSGDAGTEGSGFGFSTLLMGSGTLVPNNVLPGNILESGIWAQTFFSAAQMNDMDANMHIYWRYP